MKKFIKTDAKKRSTYTYVDVKGKLIATLTAGSSGVTAEDIRQLHLEDDREVRNNLKNSRLKLEKWQKEEAGQWEQTHPYEKFPKNWVLSVEGELEDESKSLLMAQAAIQPECEITPEIDRLHEAVEKLKPQQQALIQAVFYENKSLTEIAQDEGVTHVAIINRLKKIYKQLQKNF
ncbi:sigma factor-like helix-turn-helix DNA-binding protein [Lactovum odontotermitis]